MVTGRSGAAGDESVTAPVRARLADSFSSERHKADGPERLQLAGCWYRRAAVYWQSDLHGASCPARVMTLAWSWASRSNWCATYLQGRGGAAAAKSLSALACSSH